MLGGPVAFELAIVNADKPRLDFHSIAQRLAQFEPDLLAITGAPLFVEKARVFPNTTFVVGYDTAERLIDPRFYGQSRAQMHAALDELRGALPRVRDARVVRATVIREPRATFSLAPGQPPRPGTHTNVPGLFLAGDWIDTGLPATIEGAVRSGHRAAEAASPTCVR